MEGGRGFDCVPGDGERLRGRSEVCIFGFGGVLFVDIVVIVVVVTVRLLNGICM